MILRTDKAILEVERNPYLEITIPSVYISVTFNDFERNLCGVGFNIPISQVDEFIEILEYYKNPDYGKMGEGGWWDNIE